MRCCSTTSANVVQSSGEVIPQRETIKDFQTAAVVLRNMRIIHEYVDKYNVLVGGLA